MVCGDTLVSEGQFLVDDDAPATVGTTIAVSCRFAEGGPAGGRQP